MGWTTNFVRMIGKRIYRIPMTLLIRNLVSWKPLTDPVPGFTVVIGCMKALAPVAIANLRLCARQSSSQLYEILLVFDCPYEEIPSEVVTAVHEIESKVRVRLIGYNTYQSRIARAIHWGWVYAWMSWCLGISLARTRAVLLHDLDALPVDPNLFDELYQNWVNQQVEFCGMKRYTGSGVTPEMELLFTYELVLDASYMRKNFRPFDLFNKLKLVNGRLVDFDTILYTQWLSPRRALCPVDEDRLVHPSQLICNFTDLKAGRTDFHGRSHMLPVLAYYMFLGGDEKPLVEASPSLSLPGNHKINLFGRETYIDGIQPLTWAWMEKQIRRMEQFLYGATRPTIQSYLVGFVHRADSFRTVGKETEAKAVPDL